MIGAVSRKTGIGPEDTMTKTPGWNRREFDNGTVVYNPMGATPVTVTFSEERTSLSSLKTARTHKINPCDGDIFLLLPPRDR